MDAKRFMILKEIKNTFHRTLSSIYETNEIDSFFYLLTEHILGMTRLDLALKPEFVIGQAEGSLFIDALNRLKKEEPIQYIIGTTEFFGLPFKVNAHTLIPRPETEELVEWIVVNTTSIFKKKSLKILDIGTGTGCIAISLAKQLADAKVYALDVSEEALKVAKHNAQLNNVELTFIEDNILDISHTELVSSLHKFDIIVSNPPYVRNSEKSKMKNNVLNYEPDIALFVQDETPLIFYNAITQFAIKHLNEGGMLFFEINQYLGEEMITLLEHYNFKDIELKKDIFGNHRMVKGVKCS